MIATASLHRLMLSALILTACEGKQPAVADARTDARSAPAGKATAVEAIPEADIIPDAPGTKPDAVGTIPIASDDRQMAAAIARARAGLPAFFAKFLAKPAGTESYQVKFNLLPGKAAAEYIWATGLDYDGKALAGRLSNVPEAPGFEMGQPMLIPIEDIVDWGYFENGRMVGHYTTAVLLEHMTPEEAAEIRTALGWRTPPATAKAAG